jgi:hypothetical protein
VKLTTDSECALTHVAEAVTFGRIGVVEADAIVRYFQNYLGVLEEQPKRGAPRPRVSRYVSKGIGGDVEGRLAGGAVEHGRRLIRDRYVHL